MSDLHLERRARGVIRGRQSSHESLRRARRDGAIVERYLQDVFGRALVSSRTIGSLAKGTSIGEDVDLDLFLSFSSSIGAPLEILNRVVDDALREKFVFVRRQNVSLGVTYAGRSKIDVVPGKRQRPHGGDHSLWSRHRGSFIKTNVVRQVQFVRDSERLDEIKLAKVWRDEHRLPCPSFLLELLVVRSLHRRRRDRLVPNFIATMEFISRNIRRCRVTDPGNRSNVVSDDLAMSTREAMADAARAELSRRPEELFRWA